MRDTVQRIALWALVAGFIQIPAALVVAGEEIPIQRNIVMDYEASAPEGPRTYLTEDEYEALLLESTPQPALEPELPPANTRWIRAKVSVFYPKEGEQTGMGACWLGMNIDSHDNLYPMNAGGNVYKLLPDGTLINGVDDVNCFATGGKSFRGELDEDAGFFYTAGYRELRSAPFREGSVFSTLMSGVQGGQSIVKGRAELAGSLLITEDLDRVSRATLEPPGMGVFSDTANCFAGPQSIASGPDGSLYVTNLYFSPAALTKVSPSGEASIFAIADTPGYFGSYQSVAVDTEGSIYWSQPYGINKYDSAGTLLGTLPPPRDPPRPSSGKFVWTGGAVFDSSGDLYVVHNYGCKRILKYTFPRKIEIDVEPESSLNRINCSNPDGVVTVAILSTREFDALSVDHATVNFMGAGEMHIDRDSETPQRHEEDMNGDGRLDLVFHFRFGDSALSCESTEGTLLGTAGERIPIEGTDAVSMYRVWPDGSADQGSVSIGH